MKTVLLAELGEALVGASLASVVGTLVAAGGVALSLLGLLGLLGVLLLAVVLDEHHLLLALGELGMLLGELSVTLVAGMKTVLLAELGEALVGAGLASVVGTLVAAGGVALGLLGLLGLLGVLLLAVVLDEHHLLLALGELGVVLGELSVTLVAGMETVLLAELGEALVGASLASVVGTLVAAGGIALSLLSLLGLLDVLLAV